MEKRKRFAKSTLLNIVLLLGAYLVYALVHPERF